MHWSKTSPFGIWWAGNADDDDDDCDVKDERRSPCMLSHDNFLCYHLKAIDIAFCIYFH